jgi:two-component system NarL family sensor kinase
MEDSGETGDLKRRNRELFVLGAVARELNRSVDLSEALRFALAQAAELLDLRTGWIWLLNEESGEPYLAAFQNLPPALSREPSRMEGYCYCLDTYEAGDLEGAANVNVLTCSRLSGLVDGTGGLRYHASIPLYAPGGKRLGVMNVASPGWRSLSAEDLRLLYTVGDLLSIAIERARLFERSARLGATEERNRLAREIHDTITQGLTATLLQLESAEALLEGEDRDRAARTVRRALSLTRSNLEEARRSVQDLRAAPLEGRSLPEALEMLVREWETREGAEAELEVVGGARPLPPRVEVCLYRVCQEALGNVARHARAHNVSVRLEATPERALLAVEDDGRGFDPGRVPEGRYGLAGMEERARFVGGTFELRSRPGAGTRVVVSVSLEGA